MIGHLNFKRFDDSVLITNDFGKFMFLSMNQFADLLDNRLSVADPVYEELRKRFFIIEKSEDLLSEDRIHAIQEMKSYLFSGTSLHIFAVTNACNLNCVYCQAKDKGSKLCGYMSEDVGMKAIHLALQSPSKELTFEFQGGEPLLNFEIIRKMILETERQKGDKQISYTLVSNLQLLTEDKLDFLEQYKVNVSTSLDGPRNVQEYNRRTNGNESSYDIVEAGYRRLKERGIAAGGIETTTRYSLQFPEDIVDTYLNMGISGIFIRPLTPLGFAKADWEVLGYKPEEFLEFYRKAFARILKINMQGTFFPEYLAVYFLKKILQGFSMNYMELRSPCGAVTGQLSYYYDGNVYTCDEGRMVAEMGDNAFKLGTIDSSYDELVDSPVCKATQAASVIESLPTCSDCVYQPYCGVCPVVTYATDGDIFPRGPGGFRCRIYKGIQDMIFEYLKEADPEIISVFYRWIGEE